MKIEWKSKKIKDFEDLNPGECFTDHGLLYMKVSAVTNEFLNAVNLSSGDLVNFLPGQEVEFESDTIITVRR